MAKKDNPVKLKQDADAHEKAGRFEKAIELLKQLVQDNPRDWNNLNRIGDLYAKLNNTRAANEYYIKVARYFAEDGFYLKAIAVWKKVLRNEPSLSEGLISLADLYAKQGLVAEAKQTYGEVIDNLRKRNKLREAGDVLRRVLDVDPSDMKARIQLAELYARDGAQEKAAQEYVAIADELVKKGHLAEALQLIEKALRTGPRSARLVSAAARVYLVQKDYARAVGLLEEAQRALPSDRDVALGLAEAYLGSRMADKARLVLERLIQQDPGDLDARQQLGQVSLAEGRHDEAFEQLLPAVERLVEKRQIDQGAALLQQIVQRNPAHIRSLAKLVELYRQSRNDLLVVQTYSQMVEAYLAGGELDQAASILEVLVQLEPHNEQHRSKLRWIREQHGGAASTGFEVDFQAPSPSVAAGPPPAPEPAAIELSGPLGPEDQEFVTEHLAEGRVFRKYGLSDKARDQFEAILGRFPDNLEALQELADLHGEKGEKGLAAQHLRVMATVLRLQGDEGRAERVEAEASSLVGPAAPVPEPAAAPAPAPPAAAPPRAPAAPSPPTAAPPAAPAPSQAAAPTPADVGIEITLEEPAADEEELEYVDPGSGPAEPEPLPTFDEGELAPAGEIGAQFLDEEPAAMPPDEGFDLDMALPSPPPSSVATTGLRAQAAPGPSAAGDAPLELKRALDEIESYVSMGFVEDARGILEDAAARFPGHPFLLRRLADLGLDLPSPAAPAAASVEELVLVEPPPSEPAVEEPLQLGADFLEFTPANPTPAGDLAGDEGTAASGADGAWTSSPQPGDGGFDLASELGGLFGAQPAVATEPEPTDGTDFGDASLADIFREFQKGVDKQLGKEDYETRYNLGIAYKEMGLVDEAIAEFQLAAKDETRLLECASMLGICFLEKGMAKLAVKWFEKGLQAPGRSEDEYKGIRYDLANALEHAGDLEGALALFTEVYGQDAKFRDDEPGQGVAERVEGLRERIRQGARR